MARKISVQIVGDSRSLERAFGRSAKAGNAFSRSMRAIGKVGAGGIAGGFVALGLAVRAGFGELAEAQKVAAQTSAVLRSTGGVANVTAKQVDALATSISRMSGIDDEAVASAENILLTFTGIRNEAGKGNRVFDRTTMAVTNMATALGMDLNSAALMVGKAMNQMDVTSQGNVRGFMALRRVGVQVTPEMMRMAAAFIRAGQPMEAQKLLLRELETEFGGSARAYGQTMPGALSKMRNAFNEAAAAFATGFLPVVQKVAHWLTAKLSDPKVVANLTRMGNVVGNKLYNAFVGVSTWFDAHWAGIKQGFSTAAQVLRLAAVSAMTLFKALKKIADIVPGSGITDLMAMIAALYGGKALLGGGVSLPGGKGKGGGKMKGRGKFKLPGGVKGAVASSIVAAGVASIATDVINDALHGPADNEKERRLWELARVDPAAASRRAKQWGYRMTPAQAKAIAGQSYHYGIVPGSAGAKIGDKIRNWRSMGASFSRGAGGNIRVAGRRGQTYHTFAPGSAGYGQAAAIVNHGTINITTNATNAKQLAEDLRRNGKTKSGSQRGRHAGSRAGIG